MSGGICAQAVLLSKCGFLVVAQGFQGHGDHMVYSFFRVRRKRFLGTVRDDRAD